jgi:acrylyl-CoA reductase (NADPH)
MIENHNQTKFKALVVRKEDKNFSIKIRETDINFLPVKGVLIKVYYSSINYKDRMSCRGDMTITRRFPHIPGIDAVGVVVATDTNEYAIGDRVIASSFDLGMNTPGGFGQYVRVPAKWVTKLPAELDLYDAAAIGTAGYTAFLAARLISKHINSKNIGSVAVTGATGGVGCFAIFFLKLLRFHIIAITTKPNAEKFLVQIGADEVVNGKNFVNSAQRSLLPESLVAGLDTVGGEALSTILRSVKSNGIVCAIGMVNATTFPMSIMPFILRGISLTGVNADLNHFERERTWQSIAKLISNHDISKLSDEISLDQLPERMDQMEHGLVMGRTVVKHQIIRA